ncbi:MAG: hypothetical protein ISS94_03245 [Candidatus Syntrophoarchaeum sp.]|nr:hypothetical protein [Candidatus Syntrophoarchaeum sp.]
MKTKFNEIIYSQLKEAQEKYGGYTGKDISAISRKINRQPKTVRRHIEKLREKDAAFSNFTYIGKQYIDLTLDEISFLQYRMQDNCLMLKSLLREELNKRRTEEGKSQIAQSTFYRFIENLMNSMGIERINERLKECEKWLNECYVWLGNPIRHYDLIKRRKHKLRSLLASIKSDESIAIQVRLIFEIQVCFFVDLLDFLIEQLIINKGRIYRLMNDKRAKVFLEA